MAVKAGQFCCFLGILVSFLVAEGVLVLLLLLQAKLLKRHRKTGSTVKLTLEVEKLFVLDAMTTTLKIALRGGAFQEVIKFECRRMNILRVLLRRK